MELQNYKEYKDSGIDWLGEIPKHWEPIRLKFLLSTLESGSRETGGGSQLDDGVFSLGGEHISWEGNLLLENKKLISEEYYDKLSKGKIEINDILLVKDGATIGKTAIVEKKEFNKMAVNEHVFLLRNNIKSTHKYLYYLICSDIGFKQIKLTEVGSAQGGINTNFISKVICPLPPKQEQIQIANYLDKKTEQINQLIEKNEILIELTKEKKTALINEIVTRGLNKDVELKESGIEWVEKIPKHWKTFKFKDLIDVRGRVGWRALSTGDYVDEGPMLLGAGDINDNNKFIQKNETHIPIEKYDESPEIKIEKNDVIAVKVGATIGRVAIVKEVKQPMTINAALFILRCYNGIYADYLYYLLCADFMNKQLTLNVAENARGNLFQRDINKIFSTVPPIQEQKEIVEYLDKEIKRIDLTIEKINKEITLLKEYKESLINNVVTGKIKVSD